jgi:hypothetical protein
MVFGLLWAQRNTSPSGQASTADACPCMKEERWTEAGRDCLQDTVNFEAGSSKDSAANRRSSSFDGWLSTGPKLGAPPKPPAPSKAASTDAAGRAPAVALRHTAFFPKWLSTSPKLGVPPKPPGPSTAPSAEAAGEILASAFRFEHATRHDMSSSKW